MKFITSILAVVVLFLSTQCITSPANAAPKTTPGKKSCCSAKKCSTEKEDTPPQDCNDMGNPFMACCGYLYDNVQKHEFSFPKPLVVSVKNGSVETQFNSADMLSVWHPPESWS